MRERTDGQGFATRAIHAGERPDPVDPRPQAADLRDSTFAFDTAAEKEDAVDRALGVGARRVLLLADRQPDEPGARGEDRLARGRRGLRRLVVRDGGRVGHAVRASRGRRPPGRGRRAVRHHRVLLDEDFPRRGIDVTAVDMTDLAAVEAAITPATKALFMETSSNPRLRDRGPRRARGDRPPARRSCSSPTTRSSARPSSGRSSTAPTSSSTPRRSTCPATAMRCRASSRAARP